MGLLMACCRGLYGILTGLTKSTDHASIACKVGMDELPDFLHYRLLVLGANLGASASSFSAALGSDFPFRRQVSVA